MFELMNAAEWYMSVVYFHNDLDIHFVKNTVIRKSL